MTRQYFGTDGIRGRVGQPPMTADFAVRLGWAAGRILGRTPGARVVIGKDTRRSGYLFESALEAGLSSAGVEVLLLGPIPTPAVAYLTRALRAEAGIVISASHNPHEDNGVKFFGPNGGKLSDAIEGEIEHCLSLQMETVAPEQLGLARRIEDAPGRYIEYCKATFGDGTLDGLRLVVDCGHGAAYRVGPAIFDELGADVLEVIGAEPDGFNINRGCGSTQLDALQAAVRRQRADVGIAFDGDADRCLMVDARGQVVDGDQILYALARGRHVNGELRGPVVGTLMSNLGLEQALAALAIPFERVAVGDRHVLERLQAVGGTLGGETSGHTLCLDKSTTGDGCVTALQVLAVMLRQGQPLDALVADMVKCPQVLINVPVSGNARQLMQHPQLQAAAAAATAQLGKRGRLLLRPSGTEPLLRVMVEAEDAEETRQVAAQLADVVRGVAGIP
ncbi:phosphoglucosamine mutase [Flagellatimonas centrodinii]|uniref:phosphoglucosamine mutase n=1 Tax=Flagellatimonas centrodinii TaxID=2806210 RepID=UPI001FEE8D1C|nr:phosphoglucosamine mutase [Flagellatimonas centrodinii]ULQ45828.1 phosphoglucosamine mutase [Flagellatimonas centrodinii]